MYVYIFIILYLYRLGDSYLIKRARKAAAAQNSHLILILHCPYEMVVIDTHGNGGCYALYLI